MYMARRRVLIKWSAEVSPHLHWCLQHMVCHRVGVGAAIDVAVGREVRVDTRYNFDRSTSESDGFDVRNRGFDFLVGIAL